VAESFREIYQTSHDGLRLYHRLYEGPSAGAPKVLCLHGLTRNSRDFEDLAPHLQKRYRVIVPDLRGRGLSARDPNMQNYQPSIYVQDVLAILATFDPAPLTIIGTSLGGMLAMMLAVTKRSSVAGIVLNDVGPEIDPAGIERIKKYAGRLPPARSWADAIAQAQTVYGAAWPDLAAARWPILARRGYRENAAGVPQADYDPLIGEAVRAAPAAPVDLWPLWKALGDLPALAIRGVNSDILSAATFARMKSEKSNVEQLSVPNRGHVPLLDEPECLASIDGFLRQVNDQRG
jgi:pimeloyl-ACP methyl ester carboxylesterase